MITEPTPPTPTPSIGRIVQYHSYGTPGGEYLPKPRAAIVTTVDELNDDRHGRIGVAVLNPTGLFFDPSIPYSEEPRPGHWSWPPRV